LCAGSEIASCPLRFSRLILGFSRDKHWFPIIHAKPSSLTLPSRNRTPWLSAGLSQSMRVKTSSASMLA
jgi:hypothetical protein